VTLLGIGLGIILLAGLLARAMERRSGIADRVFRWGMLAGCLMGTVAALLSLAGPDAAAEPGSGYGLDPLSSWFVAIVLGVGSSIAVYGTHYMAHERPARAVGAAHLFLSILLIALTGVVTARSVAAFLIAWEVMAIAAWLLVIFERERAEVRRAGFVYLALTHVSTLALFGMFAAWGGDGSFSALAAASGQHRAPAGLILVLGLVGFGIKAGAVPGHIWLPGAHAAAPSHISALLSGVMLKVGIYGLFRMLVLSGEPPAWWGWVVLLLGLVSAVLGVLWALAQHDLKRLLAYHSVENIGIILMGLGLGALGSAYHHPAVALLGYTGALLHSLNHSLFKSLLFFGAGAIVRVAGTREIDRLGGLARTMPRSAWAFLLGSIAIVGLPPLNGFVSEWVVFRGLLESGTTAGALRTASVLAAGLALTGALALACFSKVHGVIFLGSPRREGVLRPGAERGLVAPQVALAGACLTIGVAPFLVVPLAARLGAGMVPGPPLPDALAAVTSPVSAISWVALGLLLLSVIIWRLRATAVPQTRPGPTWGCAFPGVSARTQYSAASYAAGLLAAFGVLSGTRRTTGPAGLQVHSTDPVIDSIGRPVWDRLRSAALGLRRYQTARLSWYLVYVIAALFGLLVYLWLVAAA
jgi:hydrogenase-4 component B